MYFTILGEIFFLKLFSLVLVGLVLFHCFSSGFPLYGIYNECSVQKTPVPVISVYFIVFAYLLESWFKIIITILNAK